MSTYRLKNNPGCVVHEFEAWQAGVDKTPLREAFPSEIDTITFGPARDPETDKQIMWIHDMLGAVHLVKPGDFIFVPPGQYGTITVVAPEIFHETFEVSNA